MKVEVVACSVDDCQRAEQAGADRVELCVALELGGLTPTAGLFAQAQQAVKIPVVPMIRPRPGGFHYSVEEVKLMGLDLHSLVSEGAEAVVVGALTAEGELELDRLKAWRDRFPETDFIMHRAFDTVGNPAKALEALIRLGFVRVLTSGQKLTAFEGASALRDLVQLAKDRITVVAAGSIRAENVVDLGSVSGVSEVHLGPTHPVESWSSTSVNYGSHQVLDFEQVRAVVRALRLGDYSS
jgi:copper homeostasis protein